MNSFSLAIAMSLMFSSLAQAQGLDDLISDEMTFSLEQYGDLVRTNFRDSASGHSNGIGYTLTGERGAAIFTGYSNDAEDQEFNDLPMPHDAIHIGSNFTLTFDEPVQALLVATANDNATGDGFDFGMTPLETVDIGMQGTFMHSLDPRGTLALFVLVEPAEVWESISEDAIADGIDLAFFAYPVWPPAAD